MSPCTITVPSRGRIEQLFRCIDSINETSVGLDYAIAVYLDDDDTDSLSRLSELESIPQVKVTVGPQPNGVSLDTITDLLANKFPSTWLWIVNDDMTIKAEDRGWDELLEEVPTTGYWVQPEIHQLNASVYPRDERSCSPTFINGCWKTLFGCDAIPSPCDDVLIAMLKRHGWKPWFLKGITVWHQRNKP